MWGAWAQHTHPHCCWGCGAGTKTVLATAANIPPWDCYTRPPTTLSKQSYNEGRASIYEHSLWAARLMLV